MVAGGEFAEQGRENFLLFEVRECGRKFGEELCDGIESAFAVFDFIVESVIKVECNGCNHLPAFKS